MPAPPSFEAYCGPWPAEVQARLITLRQLILKLAPHAQETISYGMPAFKFHGPLAYFAAFKNHIGLYALPSGNAAFKAELKNYKTGKGSIQFPHNQPLPTGLIVRIIKFRIAENRQKSKT